MIRTTMLAATAAITALLPVAAPVAAQANPAMAHKDAETRAVQVPYADLDLGTAEGQRELDRRIDRAAREACSASRTHVGSRITAREARECQELARRQLGERVAELTRNAALGG